MHSEENYKTRNCVMSKNNKLAKTKILTISSVICAIIIVISANRAQAFAPSRNPPLADKKTVSFCAKAFRKSRVIGIGCFIGKWGLKGADEIAKYYGYYEISDEIRKYRNRLLYADKAKK